MRCRVRGRGLGCNPLASWIATASTCSCSRPTTASAEANARAIVRPFFRTLGLELHEDGTTSACQGAVICAKHEGEVHPSDVEDLGCKIMAAEKLLDRVYGKPRVAVEVFGAGDGAAIAIDALGLNLAALSDEELEVLQKLAERSEER